MGDSAASLENPDLEAEPLTRKFRRVTHCTQNHLECKAKYFAHKASKQNSGMGIRLKFGEIISLNDLTLKGTEKLFTHTYI